MKYIKSITTGVLAFLFLASLTPALAQQGISQLNQWKTGGAAYLQPISDAYGLKIPGLATSTTGCLAVNSSGWISANGIACGSGGGGGGSGSVGTSSVPTIGQLSYWTSAGTPSLLGSVATNTLSGTGVVTITNSPKIIGGAAAVASLTGGSNSQILAWLAGIPTWVATSSNSCPGGSGLGCTYTSGVWTFGIPNNGLTLAMFPTIAANTVIGNLTGSTATPTAFATSSLFQNASAGSSGLLTSTDWSTFNGKQIAGNYITALTGDITASGPGSVASTLATVNGNVGSFTNANITVNGKGLITAASNGTGGSGGSGTVGTSSSETSGRIPFWTTTSQTPALLSGGNSAFTFDGTRLNTTFASSTFISASGGATVSGQLFVGNTGASTNGTLFTVSTTTVGAANFSTSVFSPDFITYSGGLGSTLNDELNLASFGFSSTNETGFSVHAVRTLQGGSSYVSSSIGLSLDQNGTRRAGGQLWLSGNGNTGVSTSTPGATLGVSGNGYFTGGVGIGAVNTSAGTFTTTGNATIGGTLTLPLLTSLGGLAVTSTGAVYNAATTTAGTGLTYTGNAFNVNTTQNISRLSNLTAGFVKSDGSGNLSNDTNTYLTSNQSITLSGVVTGSGSTAITTAFPNASANTALANATGASAAPTFVATSTFFGAGVPGQVLGWDGTKTVWVATSTSGGGGVSFAWPFTPLTNFGLNTSATTTALWAQGGIFASSSSRIASTTFAINGNVGVASDTPSSKLDVRGNAGLLYLKSTTNSASAFQLENSQGSTSVQFGDADTSGVFFHAGTSTVGTNYADLNISATTGNVGIGTTSPFAGISVVVASSTATQSFPVLMLYGLINNITQFFIGFDAAFHFILGGPTPTLSTGTFMGTANDNAGIIQTPAGSATTLTLTFARARESAASCVANFSTTTSAIAASSTLTGVVFAFASVNNVTFSYHCFGTQ